MTSVVFMLEHMRRYACMEPGVIKLACILTLFVLQWVNSIMPLVLSMCFTEDKKKINKERRDNIMVPYSLLSSLVEVSWHCRPSQNMYILGYRYIPIAY